MKTATAKRLRWTVRDYFRLGEIGLPRRRVELLDGVLILSPPQSTAHMAAVSRAVRVMVELFHPRVDWVVIRGTLCLPRHNAPDPDFHVFDVPTGTPDEQLPLPFILFEISEANTYAIDAGLKQRIYARAGIADYWIAHIPQRRVEVYRRPENPTPGRRSGWRYADVSHFKPGDTLHPLARPNIAIAVDALLP